MFAYTVFVCKLYVAPVARPSCPIHLLSLLPSPVSLRLPQSSLTQRLPTPAAHNKSPPRTLAPYAIPSPRSHAGSDTNTNTRACTPPEENAISLSFERVILKETQRGRLPLVQRVGRRRQGGNVIS